MKERARQAQQSQPQQQQQQPQQQSQQQQPQQQHLQSSLLQHDGEVSLLSISKLLNPDGDWDKDQLGDVLHWLRQALGLFLGILWGLVPLTGYLWLLAFVALSTAVVYGYYAHVLKIDEEEFGGHASLLQEGMFASLTLFLLGWILVYSLVHF